MDLLLDLSVTNLYIKDLCHLVNTLIFTKSIIKTVVLTKLISLQERNLSCIQLVFHPYCYQKYLKVVYPTTQQVNNL